jgi:hypothetical protein
MYRVLQLTALLHTGQYSRNHGTKAPTYSRCQKPGADLAQQQLYIFLWSKLAGFYSVKLERRSL